MLELIMELLIEPIFNFLERRHTSGEWHVSHLLPVALAAFLGIWWLGDRWDSVLLQVFGVTGAAVAGLLNLIIFIPRGRAAKKDFDAYIARKHKEAKEKTETEGEKKS